MELTLVTGSAALDLAGSEAFRQKWARLLAGCPWATACQHPDFVVPWYRLYQARFLPIVVHARAHDGELLGLLPLALETGGRTITGAGERQAEYQCWLAGRGHDGFAGAAIRKVLDGFPGADIRLRYLPPDIPLDWLGRDAGYGLQEALSRAPSGRLHYALRSHPRPLIRLDPAAAERQRNKKNHRQNYNRLSRMGIVAFSQLDDESAFMRVFDDICIQYDFRQGVLHHQLPFRDDPLKKRFYAELYRRGLLHVATLTVDGVLAAAHVGLLSAGRAVHLGINTHAPAFAAHSPGSLLIAMLAVQLAQQALPVFDLTPGGDAYKQHFATDHDVVFELVVYGSGARRLAQEALAGAHRLARQAALALGYRRTELLQAFDTLRSLARGRRLRDTILWACTGKGYRRYRLRYSPGAARSARGAPFVAVDSLSAALDYDARSSPLGYWQFLRQAAQRMERASRLYSLARNGKLLAFCWLKYCPTATLPGALRQVAGQAPVQSDGAILLFDLHVHPDVSGDDLLHGFVEGILRDLYIGDRAGRGGAQLSCDCQLDPGQRRTFAATGFTDAPGPAFPPDGLRLWEPWEQRP